MRLRPLVLTVSAATLLVAGACDATDKPADEAVNSTISSVKTDCPDCDPAGPNAFVQTGVGSGFYKTNDHWQVAYRYNNTPLAEKHEVFLGEDLSQSDVFLFDYVATHTDRDVFDNVLRDTVTVEVSQAIASGADAAMFSADRLDRHEQRVVFTMNDLLEPISEVVFSIEYPHGKTIELDSKSSLRTGASLFPRTIPRLLVEGKVDSPPPSLPPELKVVADAMQPGWEARSYTKYTFDNDDVVYWAKGSNQLWPFFTETRGGAGVLVSWN